MTLKKEGRSRSFRIRGVTHARVFEALRQAFGNRVHAVDDDELVDIKETELYRRMSEHMTPGKYLRVYREREGWSQSELGTRLGNLQRQNVSRLERDERGISKDLAKQLAELFDVPVERFL